MNKLVDEICSLFSISDYDVPKPFRENPLLSPYKCPTCEFKGVWRMGQEFDHMKRCPHCKIVWTPDSVAFLQQCLAEEQINQLGDGI